MSRKGGEIPRHAHHKKEEATVAKLLVAILAAILALGAPVSAQTKPSIFPSQEIAMVAYLSGNFSFYTPLYLGGKLKNPVDGKTKIAAPIEGDAIAHMVTMQGWKSVPLQSGTILRWNVSGDGTKTPYAHDACGNDIDGIIYPSVPIPSRTDTSATTRIAPEVAPPPAPVPTRPRVVAPATTRYVFPDPVAIREGHRKWPWIVGGVMAVTGGVIYAVIRHRQPGNTGQTLPPPPPGGGGGGNGGNTGPAFRITVPIPLRR